MKKRITFLTVCILLAGWTNLQAKTIYYVKVNGTGNGTSWTNAAGNIQDMIDKATTGDEVWVEAGTYYPVKGTDGIIAFTPQSGVNVFGGFMGIETNKNERAKSDMDKNGIIEPWEFTNVTILENYRVVNGNRTSYSGYIIRSETAFSEETIFDGFTCSAQNYAVHNEINGVISNCIVTGGRNNRFGGGIYNKGTVSNCSVFDNKCYFSTSGGSASVAGAGIFNEGTVKNCRVFNNWCYVVTSGAANTAAASGGGIANYGVVINCCVTNNEAYSSCPTGKRVAEGGGIYNNGTVYCSTILNNVGNSVEDNILGTDIAHSYNCITEFLGSNNFVNPSSFTGYNTNKSDELLLADWRLQSGSQYLDAGSTENIPDWIINGTDLAGNPRIHNGKIDMGAYEYSGDETSINQLPSLLLSIYPNPAAESVTISGLQGNETLHFYNISGNRLLSRQAAGETETVAVAHLPAGVYFVITNNGQVLKWMKK